MKRNESASVSFAIRVIGDYADEEAPVRDLVAKRLPGLLTPPQPQPNRQGKPFPIEVGTVMYACLEGDGVKIDPPNCTTANTVQDSSPIWRWNVTPEQATAPTLHLKAGIMAGSGPDSRKVPRLVLEQAVGVEEDLLAKLKAWQKRAEDWAGFGTGTLAWIVGVLGTVATLYRRYRKILDFFTGKSTELDPPT